MKLVKAFIHHVRTVEVVQALKDAGFKNITLQDVKGMLKPVSEGEQDYSSDAGAMVISEARLSLVCEDREVESAVAIIRDVARIGPNISGWVYVSPVEMVLPIGDAKQREKPSK